MDMSESIKKLTAALAKAQGEFNAVPKTGHNPFLKNTYVTLDDIIGAIRGPLSKNGIAFTQPLTGNGDGFVLETLLLHESGEWLSCSTHILAPAASKGTNALQALGGSITYMRRYMLTALLGVNAEEDADGNGDKPKAAMHEAMADAIAPHWIKQENVRKAFWAWTRGDLTLTEEQVHEALNVEHVKEFPGTMIQAKELIVAWVKGQSEEAPA